MLCTYVYPSMHRMVRVDGNSGVYVCICVPYEHLYVLAVYIRCGFELWCVVHKTVQTVHSILY